jgi:hypothetical protein
MASAISDRVATPVEIITGFPFDAIYSISGMSVISSEATLYQEHSLFQENRPLFCQTVLKRK